MVAREHEVLSTDRLQHVLGDRPCGGLLGARQEHGKLVSADAGDDVGVAHSRGNHSADVADHLIAACVAERVIDVLEAVDVDQQHRRLPAVAIDERHFLREALLELAPVEQPGQPVAIGELTYERLAALAFGGVADRAQHERSLVGLERADADLDGELGAILAATVQIEVATHRPSLRIPQTASLVSAMAVPQPLGDQDPDALSDQLLAAVAEHPLSLCVGERDMAVRVDHHHRVGRGLQQRAELLLRPDQKPVAPHRTHRDAVEDRAEPEDEPAQYFAKRHHQTEPSVPARSPVLLGHERGVFAGVSNPGCCRCYQRLK